MALPIAAAPIAKMFLDAVGLSIAGLAAKDMVDVANKYIEANPDESIKILSTIVPNIGIGQIFMNKEKISLEDLDEMTDEEAQDLTKEEKAELMKQAGKSGGKNKRQTMIDISEKLGLSGEGKEKQDIEYDIDERYDEGGVEEVSKPKFDYKKFFKKRYADGGAIGIEVLFEEKKPRKNFFMGGPALEGPALGIYNSMKAYNSFTDQEIADAIKEAGYELPTSSTPPDSTPGQTIGFQGSNDSSIGGAPSSLVSDFKTQTQNRQNRLTNPNKVQSFINKFTGGGQADIGEMIRTGQIDTRASSGIPLGVGAAFARMMPDKYYDMSLGDQVFTQSQMGYTGPTVFGENTSGLNKDPFGLNTRSAFGNYAEAVGENFNSLRESLTGRLADKYGVEFDEETGMFVGANAKLANQMTNMMRTKFNFRKDQLAAKNRLDEQIKAAEAERQKQIELQKKIEAEAAAGKSLSQIGRENFTGEGMAFQAGNTDQGGGVTKGKVQKSSSVPGGYYGSPRKDGGLMFAKGGLATMFKEKR
jgi:hypothetical protein